MKTLLIILTFWLSKNIYCQDQLHQFNEVLGKDQSSAFDQAAESYNKFLDLNYSNQKSLAGQNSQFLKDFQNMYLEGTPNWKLPDDIPSVLDQWEETGLRKEIRLWPNEKYYPLHFIGSNKNDSTESENIEVEIEDEIIPILPRDGQSNSEPTRIDSFLVSNIIGKFFYALDQCCSRDTLVMQYLEAKQAVGDISPAIMAAAFYGYGENLSDPILNRIIIAELYYFLMTKEM